MWNLISGLKTLRENSVQIFLLAIWSLNVLKRIVKIFPKILLNKEIKKAGLQFNPGLVLISLWTTGPWFFALSSFQWKLVICSNSIFPKKWPSSYLTLLIRLCPITQHFPMNNPWHNPTWLKISLHSLECFIANHVSMQF